MQQLIKRYSLGEEIANAITHGIGAALSVAALVLLATFAALYGDVWRVVSVSIYGATLILLYLFSTLYHGIQHPRAKEVLRVLDHSAIFLLIAGTYTPLALVTLHGPWGWAIFGVIWGIALVGIVLNAFLMKKLNWLFIILYVVMGWTAVVAIKPLIAMMPTGGLAWMGIGGLIYTAGVAFYAIKKIPFNHAIWHLFVLGGSICHFFGIFYYVLPMPGV
ncbi:MAG TPA: hemolysin III family protein [bacterium]|nr:hemolysin III family protein [bacterium]